MGAITAASAKTTVQGTFKHSEVKQRGGIYELLEAIGGGQLGQLLMLET